MHLAEHNAQPEQFGSIPQAMWWAIVTLTTVGYGDVVPVTIAGKMVASFTMLAGLMMLALPIGIVSKAFADEIHRREFVVTWGMLARVPLFSSLSAAEIAEVMDYLHALTAPAGSLIVRRGEAATNMYFIASGLVEVEHPEAPIRLGEGQFFGEAALINRTRRNANVRAVEATKLLLLDARDLHALMERNPEIAAHVEGVAQQRRDGPHLPEAS
jgi:voltage-gated potassium channel